MVSPRKFPSTLNRHTWKLGNFIRSIIERCALVPTLVPMACAQRIGPSLQLDPGTRLVHYNCSPRGVALIIGVYYSFQGALYYTVLK